MNTTQRYGDLELSFQLTGTRLDLIIGPPVVYTAYGPTKEWTPELFPTGLKMGPGGMTGKTGVLMLKDCSADRSLLRDPVGFVKVAQLPSSPTYPWGVWRPVPPEGYVALGDIIAPWEQDEPAVDTWARTACLKRGEHTDGRTYARQAECGTLLCQSSGGTRVWSIVTPPYPDGDEDEHLYLPVGNFTAVTSSDHPAPTDTTWILDLPAVIDKNDGPEIPELTSYSRPPTQRVITDREVIVPYYLVHDAARDEKWQVENSPFYKLRRKRHYELVLFRDNHNGTESQDESESITTGVTQTAGETFSQTTGITVGVKVGVSAGAKPFGIGVETTVTTSVSATVEIGYERRTDISIMREVTKTRGLTIPPRSSACLWMERHTLLPIRANGDTLGDQADLGFNTNYYVTGEYPSGSGPIYWETDDDGSRRELPATRLAPDVSSSRWQSGSYVATAE